MRFDRETEADRHAKDFAKQQSKKAVKNAVKKMRNKGAKTGAKAGAKAGKKAGAAAGKAANAVIQKVIAAIVGALGAPLAIILLCAVLLMVALPSLLTSSTFSIDSKYEPDGLGNTSVGSSWEDDAEAAIDTRYQGLKSQNFWADLGTFFTTGSWGTAGARFETEFANAKDADMEGTDGYFSASNRLIAIINEAYRQSLNRSRIKAEAEALATQAVDAIKNDIASSAEYSRPSDVAPEDYHINVTVAQDPEYNTDENFIYESCYMVAAASAMLNHDDTHDTGVRHTLDQAFAVTGLDGNVDQELCWEAATRAEFDRMTTSITVLGYKAKSPAGIETVYSSVDDIPEGHTLVEILTKKEVKVYAYSYWSVNLTPDWQGTINRHCGIETTLPADAAAYEITEETQVRNSALELAKYYSLAGGDWASIGEAGLPLPRGSYYISSPYGWRVFEGKRELHKGIDLAAAEGTPIYAVKDGVCSVPPQHESYGNYVTIDHGGGLITRYAHMSLVVVTDGQSVTAGEVIGFVGNTGRSSGPHLHFEVRTNDNPVDPISTELGSEIVGGQM